MAAGGVALGASRLACMFAHVSGLSSDGDPRQSSAPLPVRLVPSANLKASSSSTKPIFRRKKAQGFNRITSLSKTSRASVLVRAMAGGDTNSSKPLAPLLPESPTGQFLVSILESHPHLFAAAADQQLEQLVAEKDASSVPEESSASGTDLVLYRRIAEVKAQERRKAVEDLIYILVVQKFVEAGLKMTPKIPEVAENERVDHWPMQEIELEAVHSPEALEMIREHLGMVLGGRAPLPEMDRRTMVQMSKFHIGQVYAASIAYGYFLRRVDQRYQLERSVKSLTSGLNEATQAENSYFQSSEKDKEEASKGLRASANAATVASSSENQVFSTVGFSQLGTKPSKLRAYVLSFDVDTLKRCATMRSKESVNVIEKHTQALFGRPEVQITSDGSVMITKDGTIRLTISGLRNLVLEAVAFGSFLWDVESYVDSHYSLASQ
ncbi:hypothetical protein O6H91_05G023200 [Diphasiastrum complanatum]|uniref:Uncharacterized protein n=1 Tax=Diphasiastrum complanatum TaxID=34168 RepID=A0ACC2DLD5_DIPCM|nr:hypothetical protein O6H91_05G023200 [Diphasiastrum complanatum]